MFNERKKNRELAKALENLSENQDLQTLVNAIEEQKPAPAADDFRIRLKNKLLDQHKNMNKKAAESKSIKAEKFSLWSDFRIRGLATVIGAVMIAVIAGVIAYPMIPAPTVKGYLLKNSVREMSVNAPFRLPFTQLMDNGSVEKAFKIEPAIAGKISWEANTLVYKPDNALQLGETYTITVGSEAKSLWQKPLAGEYSEIFKIVAPAKVILVTPEDGVNVAPDTKINVMFDRPMTELTTLEASDTNFPQLKFEPQLKGRYKWLGTSTLQFIPDNLAKSNKYVVTVPAGIRSLDGGSSEGERIFSFETERLAVTGMNSTGGTSKDYAKSTFKINFNQKVDLESAKNMIKLSKVDNGKNSEIAAEIRYFNESDYQAESRRQSDLFEMGQYEEIVEAKESSQVNSEPVVDKPAQSELEKSILVIPRENLKEGNYLLNIRQGLIGIEGPLGLTQDTDYNLSVDENFKYISQSVFDRDPDQAYPEFAFNFPVDLRSLRGKISINPARKDEEGKEIKPQVTSTYSGFSIDYNFKPSTDYVINIGSGIKDVYGQTYDQPIEMKFTTPKYKPTFSLESGTDINILNWYKPSLFYVKSVNIDHVNVAMKKLSDEDFAKVYGRGYVEMRDFEPTEYDIDKRVEVKLGMNERSYTGVNLDTMIDGGRKLVPGYYFMKITNENVIDDCARYDKNYRCLAGPKTEKALFIVSKTALAYKASRKELLVWATDLGDGKPVSGMNIVAGDGTLKGETDVNGLAKIAIPDGLVTISKVTGMREGDLAFVEGSWSDGVSPWNFNIESDSYPPAYYTYLYTDRPIYRDGQEVFFKGILRKEMDYKFNLPDVKKVKVSVDDSEGNNIYQKELEVSANGTFNGSVQLGENISSGEYSIKSELIDPKPEANWYDTAYSSFKVYQYRKPEYKLDIQTDKKDFINGEKAKLSVNAAYFFGAPLKDAKITWTVKAQDYYFILPEELANKLAGSWFSFAEEGYFCYWGCTGTSEVVAQGELKSDANGLANLDLPLEISNKKMSQIYTMEATVTDANNQSVSNRISFPVHQGQYYLGIRSTDYVVDASKPAKFEAIAVTADGKVMAGQSAEISLYKRSWNTVKRKNVDGGFYFENSYDDKLIEKKNIKTGSDGLAQAEFKINEGGSYKIELTGKDTKGNTIKSSTSVYSSSGDFINWGSENNDKIELVPDKMEYKVGDTAKIMVKSPYKDVYALVTVEKDKILDKRVIRLESNSDTFEVPITEKYLPNAFVSVVLVKGSAYDAGLIEPIAGAADEREVASFKVGYVNLQVNTEGKKLNIEIKSDKAKYAPGENVKLMVKTTDFTGKAAPAELSVGVVDESVLSLTESVTADLLNVFYRQRMLGVSFAHTLTKALSRINVEVEAGLKGGGGGNGEAKRGVFKDTAHFESVVKTNANGEATVEFKLPDNLTTWQVLAIGVSEDTGNPRTLVGSSKMNFLVTKDLLVRPVLPRFMTSGDEMKIGAIVHNYTGVDSNVKVTLNAQGVELKDGNEKNVNIRANSSEKIEWQIKVGQEKAHLEFSAIANGGERGDSIEQTLPINEPVLPTHVAVGKVIDGDVQEIEKVWLPIGLDLSKGKLTVNVSATLSGVVNQGLEYLMTYPYGCTEQLASSLLPNLVLKQLANTGKFETAGVDQDKLRKNVEAGLQGIYKNQLSGGGFGLWQGSSSNAYLTAYVLSTFQEAKKAGYTVDQAVVDRAKTYLNNYLRSKDIYQNSNKVNVLNNRAYILFVLSEYGEADLALSNNLFESLKELSLASKAYMAMTYQNLLKTNSGSAKAIQDKIAILEKDLSNSAKQTPRGVTFESGNLDYWNFETNVKTTAIVFTALNRIDSKNPLIEKTLHSLLMERQAGHYSTTQETSAALIALIEYMKGSDELSPAFEGKIILNGEEKLSKAYTSKNLFETAQISISLKDLLPNNQDNEFAAQRIGKGRMYVDMDLEYFLPLSEMKARNEGIEVLQEYYSTDDSKLEKPLTAAKVGQNLHGRMTVIVPEDRNYVMIEDFLPAGLEGIDFNLKTSQQNLDQSSEGCEYECYNGWYFNHNEVRDDRVMYFADYLPKGVYEIDYYVRATSTGKFADLPVVAQETYYPEVFGRSAGRTFTVTE